MQAALDYDLPVLQTVTEEGTFIPEIRPWSGKFVKDVDQLIIQDLHNRGLLFRADTYSHSYPFCWRCDTALLYYARSSWFVRTTQYKDQLVKLNQRINWYPEHIKDGRFGNWLENNIDWALGRERYWGTPLPVWQCGSCHHQLAVGSIADLSKLVEEDLSSLDLHRPYVDEIKLSCPECKQQMQRVPEIIDVWFDSGSMPVAQWHYPFEGQVEFKHQYPADFICEGVDQTRGWFYSLHTISTLLFEQECFRNVISLGLFLDSDGRKMSKSRGNTIDPWDIFNKYGADAFRWYLYSNGSPGQDRRFSADQVEEVVRSFILPLWNVYSFFVTYALLDDWVPDTAFHAEDHVNGIRGNARMTQPIYNSLDRWLLSELHALIRGVTVALETYDVPYAARQIQTFVEMLSKWYLRRSRRRFWKSDADADKNAAYSSLYEALRTICKLLAPFMPFLAEELYKNLVGNIDPHAPESVHLVEWPSFDSGTILDDINNEMRLVMRLASLGHAARNKASIKVRQPLKETAFFIGDHAERKTLEKFSHLLAEELNVKQVRALDSTSEVVSYKIVPLPKQLGQKYKARYPAIRAALLSLDVEQFAPALMAGNSLHIDVDDEQLEIFPTEVELHVTAFSGFVVASEGAYLAALKTELTPTLFQEGLARELVRRIQDLRKQAAFEISDRIYLYILGSSDLSAAVSAHRRYIMDETLAIRLLESDPPQEAIRSSVKFSGVEAKLGIVKAD
jgi:isoleucyl-tRNA synthetase